MSRSLILLCSLLIGSAAEAQSQDLSARIDAVAQSALDDGPVAGLSIAVVQNGEAIHARGYGVADTEAGTPATAGTLFNAASVGKIIAAAAVLRLVDQGRLDLDDDLATLLPAFPNPGQGRSITLRQLLNHTSGLADYFYDYTRWEEEGTPFHSAFVLDFVRDHPLDFAPGTDWRYTNTAFYLAGLIVERVTGRPWGEYVVEEIARPLGLESVVLCDEAGERRSVGYDVSEDGRFVRSVEDAETGVRGDAGLCTTSRDLARLPGVLTTSGLLSEAALNAMLGPTVLANGVTVDAGLGVMRGSLDRHPLWGHVGGNPSSNVAALVHYPEADLSIAVLINTRSSESDALVIEAEIARLVLDLGDPTLLDLPLDPEAATPYLGTYVGDRGDWRYHVVADGDRITRVWADDATSTRPLLYQGDHSFGRADWPMDRFEFHVHDGRALGYSVYYNGLFGGLYRRVEP